MVQRSATYALNGIKPLAPRINNLRLAPPIQIHLVQLTAVLRWEKFGTRMETSLKALFEDALTVQVSSKKTFTGKYLTLWHNVK